MVRIEPGGASVIAGTAGPGDLVILMLDGSTIAETEADGRGAFVILTDIQPGPSPRVLTLLASGAAGERRSEASVIVAPAALPATKPAEEREGITPDETASQTVAMAAKEGQGEATEAASEEGTSQGMAGSGDEPDASEPELETAEGAAPRATPDMPAEDATPLDEAGAAASLASEAKGEEPEADGVAALPAPEAPAIAPAQALAPTAAPEAQAALPATDPQLLVTTGTGLRVLQPSASAAEVPLRVETIDYSQGGVTLSGRGTGGPSDLRIYLDNDPVAVAPLDTDGTWEAELEGVQPGTYTLRVDQLGGDGKVTGRFETPFLRESEEALARTAPADADAEGLAVSVITVQPGYSLWAIASDRYGDGMSWHKVLEANKGQIRDPDLIYPGQIFDLPE
ncbi:LysM peptidoglycan-binding domain-containing protein [Vannielia litorea]|uniref:LysM peptidoglycan-binding domain-containing protein n=1 Tax=Vannielia litorea TaxID=1217970 RepID=UPI000940BDB9|nr:LysM peptidoglycan-binding domain-containing protein [Vannielia litorea]